MRIAPPQRFLAAGALAALALLGAACGGDDDGDEPAAPAEAGVVSVEDNKFVPDTIEVAPGDTVTWEFNGATQHNVSGDGFKSDNMKDGTFDHSFNSPGEYDYVCTLHPGMNGTVVVG